MAICLSLLILKSCGISSHVTCGKIGNYLLVNLESKVDRLLRYDQNSVEIYKIPNIQKKLCENVILYNCVCESIH